MLWKSLYKGSRKWVDDICVAQTRGHLERGRFWGRTPTSEISPTGPPKIATDGKLRADPCDGAMRSPLPFDDIAPSLSDLLLCHHPYVSAPRGILRLAGFCDLVPGLQSVTDKILNPKRSAKSRTLH